jgi:hypothetical protein
MSLENLNNLEVSNVYRPNIRRNRLIKYDKQTKKRLESQANLICRDKISERYIHNAFKNLDNGFIYKDAEENEILGFCIWKVITFKDKMNEDSDPFKYLYLLLMCSRDSNYNLGDTMLNDVEYFAATNSIPIIVTRPANIELEAYYERKGYSKTCPKMYKDTMCKEIVPIKLISRKQARKTMKKNKQKQNNTSTQINSIFF